MREGCALIVVAVNASKIRVAVNAPKKYHKSVAGLTRLKREKQARSARGLIADASIATKISARGFPEHPIVLNQGSGLITPIKKITRFLKFEFNDQA